MLLLSSQLIFIRSMWLSRQPFEHFIRTRTKTSHVLVWSIYRLPFEFAKAKPTAKIALSAESVTTPEKQDLWLLPKHSPLAAINLYRSHQFQITMAL